MDGEVNAKGISKKSITLVHVFTNVTRTHSDTHAYKHSKYTGELAFAAKMKGRRALGVAHVAFSPCSQEAGWQLLKANNNWRWHTHWGGEGCPPVRPSTIREGMSTSKALNSRLIVLQKCYRDSVFTYSVGDSFWFDFLI